MTTAWFAMSAVNTFVMVNFLPFGVVYGTLVAVMTPSALTVAVYGSRSTAAGGSNPRFGTQSPPGLGHHVEPKYPPVARGVVRRSSPSELELPLRAPPAGFSGDTVG